MIITIARSFGSGGRLVAEQLSKILEINYYDKNLINIAAQQSGIDASFFAKADEQRQQSITGGLFGLRFPFLQHGGTMNSGLDNQQLFQIQSDAIRSLAEQGDCIFVGRCADYILRHRTDAINLFISANKADRVKRVQQRNEVDTAQAQQLIAKIDKHRAEYYNFYTSRRWGKASNYHLCINSSLLGVDHTADFIADFVRQVLASKQ